jgi:hypothetical protein
MSELVFQVEEDADGGFTAKAAGAAIFTEADSIEELRRNVREAVECYYDRPSDMPKVIRLHFIREEVIAL